jgi:hypothetical protein
MTGLSRDLARVDRFRTVVLDFAGLETIRSPLLHVVVSRERLRREVVDEAMTLLASL